MQMEIMFDIVASVSLLCGVGVAWWGYHKWDVAQRDTRARFLFDLVDKFRNDVDIKALVYAADHGDGMNCISEQQKDKTLTYMAFVYYLKRMGVLKDEEYGFFEYEIMRVIKNETLRGYLDFMESFGKKNGRSPFAALRDLLMRNDGEMGSPMMKSCEA